jgi:hypothetical protein
MLWEEIFLNGLSDLLMLIVLLILVYGALRLEDNKYNSVLLTFQIGLIDDLELLKLSLPKECLLRLAPLPSSLT